MNSESFNDALIASLVDVLRPLAGRRIALIAPAGGVADERIDATLAVLAAAGVKASLGVHARDHHRYLAGTAEARLADLHAAFAQPEVDAVWCLRGGYGCAHFVDAIDWSRIAPDVPLIGYSDVTVLLEAFRRAGKRAVHGPTAADLAVPGDQPTARDERVTALASLARLLAGDHPTWSLARHDSREDVPAVSGRLVGGNLTTLASIAGTPAALALDTPSILLLEDVGEAEFRLERCLHQLLASIDTDNLRAVCLGQFTNCTLADGPRSWHRIVAEWLAPRDIPLYLDAPIGHGPRNHAWTYGTKATLSPEQDRWLLRTT